MRFACDSEYSERCAIAYALTCFLVGRSLSLSLGRSIGRSLGRLLVFSSILFTVRHSLRQSRVYFGAENGRIFTRLQ